MKPETKRWMTVLDFDCWKWLRDITAKTGVSGAAIINRLIKEAMEDKTGNLIGDLESLKLRTELQKVNDKKMALEAQEMEIRKKLKVGGTKAATPA